MDGFFTELQYWHWWIAGVALVVIEILVPGTFFLWLGVSAGVTGLVLLVLPSFDWHYQILLFSALSVGSIYVGRKFWRPGAEPTDEPALNRRAQQYVGRVVSLAEPIKGGRGRARIGDSLWLVAGDDMPVGTEVRIVGVEGTVLRVARLDAAKTGTGQG
jgi:membrane protein implicated in regulation of membrane protease activity